MKRNNKRFRVLQQERYLHRKKVPVQPCPKCGYDISAVAGLLDAICQNCGYKYPCCET